MPKQVSKSGQPSKRRPPAMKSSAVDRAVDHAADHAVDRAVDQLLSGKTLRSGVRESRGRKPAKTVEKLPPEIAELADVLVAGRKIEREIRFKLEYAEKRVKDYCRQRFAEIYAATGNRMSSGSFAGDRSSFTFIQTRRISLTQEKVAALEALDVSVEGETELRGIRINYEAIRMHRLEKKLRDALEGMGVSREILAECFQPDVQFRESFFTRLSTIVEKSLAKGEELSSKLYQVVNILNPTEQIRNADLPDLNSLQSYKLIHDSPVVEVGDVEDLEEDEE